MKRANRQSKAAAVGPAGKVLKGGKVPLPSAYANAPSGGRAAAGTGEPWLVSKTIYAAYN